MRSLFLLLLGVASATVDYLDQVNWSGLCTTGTQQSPRDLLNPTDRSDISLTIKGTNWENVVHDAAVTHLWQYASTGTPNTVTLEFSGTLGSGDCSSASYTASQFEFHRTSEHLMASIYKTA